MGIVMVAGYQLPCCYYRRYYLSSQVVAIYIIIVAIVATAVVDVANAIIVKVVGVTDVFKASSSKLCHIGSIIA